jgi:4-hydroxy-tetrahydrodipicolinate synthase
LAIPHKPEFAGVVAIMPTPFLEDGSLDLDSIQVLCDVYIERGVNGLAILGVMGEAQKLLPDERAQVIETYVRCAAGRVPVVAGTSHQGTHPAIALALQAERLGCAGIMVAPPPVPAARVDDLVFDHYRSIHNAVSVPMVVQDHLASSGVLMSPQLLARLSAELERAGYLKLEDPPTPAKADQIRYLAGGRPRIFGGLGGLYFFEELEHGAAGTMTGFAFPEILVRIYDAYRSGDTEGAASVFYRYLPAIRFEFQPEIALTLRKETLYRRGWLRTPALRAPATPLNAPSSRDLENLLARLDLL